MGYIFKVTALDNKWGGAIKKGECFTIVCSSSSPSELVLKKLLTSMGRDVRQCTSLPFLGLNESIKTTNNWLIEKISKV